MPTPTSAFIGSCTNAVRAALMASHFVPTGVCSLMEPDWSYMMNMSKGLTFVTVVVTGTSTVFVTCSAFELVAKHPPSGTRARPPSRAVVPGLTVKIPDAPPAAVLAGTSVDAALPVPDVAPVPLMSLRPL
jgi:hypothetical protein